MLSKKLNDSSYWKNKLETSGYVPGNASLDKEALWEKLHGRLQHKSPERKAAWYWMAAALLPLALVAVLMNTTKPVVNNTVVGTMDVKKIPAVSAPGKTEAVVFSVSAPVQKRAQAAILKETNKPAVKQNDQSNEAMVRLTVRSENFIQEKLVNHATTTDTVTAIATNTVKKKLQVVHINELETMQFTEPVNYANTLSGIKARRKKAAGTGVAVQQNSLGFTINISPKN